MHRPHLLKGLYLMGGAVRYTGNAAALAEANFAHDAPAARAVFGAWGAAVGACELVMAPLEVTRLAPTIRQRARL